MNILKIKYLENGFKKAFKGNWGAEEHTKRPEVIQDLNRLSFNSFLSHLRKIKFTIRFKCKNSRSQTSSFITMGNY